MNKNISILEPFLLGSYARSMQASRWLNLQSLDLQLWAREQSTQQYFNLKKRHPEEDKNLLSLASSLNTAFKIQECYKRNHRKNPDFKSDDAMLLDLLVSNEFSNAMRVTPKYNFLKSKLQQIFKWRKLGISYARISEKLITPDGESISAEYVRQFVNNQKEF